DGDLLEGTDELSVVGAGAGLPRSEGGRVGRVEQAAARCDGGARVGDTVHIKDHLAVGFVTDADQVMPVVVRDNVAASHMDAAGCVANKEPERMAGGSAVQIELFAAAAGAAGDDAAIAGLSAAIGPALDREGGIACIAKANRHATYVTVCVRDGAEF